MINSLLVFWLCRVLTGLLVPRRDARGQKTRQRLTLQKTKRPYTLNKHRSSKKTLLR